MCCHVHLVYAVCQQRKVTRFPDFPENINFCDGHYCEPVIVIVLNNPQAFIHCNLRTIPVLVYMLLWCVVVAETYGSCTATNCTTTKWATFEASALAGFQVPTRDIYCGCGSRKIMSPSCVPDFLFDYLACSSSPRQLIQRDYDNRYVNHHPPARHRLDAHYDLVVNEPNLC